MTQSPLTACPPTPKRPFIVTTSSKPSRAQVARARLVAERCQGLYAPRKVSLPTLWHKHHAGLLYIVGKENERLSNAEQHLFVNPGMFRARQQDQQQSPLVLAIQNEQSPSSIIDLTTGLGQESLFLAHAFPDASVTGFEASPIMFSLLEEGFTRMSREDMPWSQAAARVHIQMGHSLALLQALPDKSTDVIYMDPMFSEPQAAPPGYELLRCAALHGDITPALLHEAMRVARWHIVMKSPRHHLPPDILAPLAPTHIQSKRLSFWRVPTT